MRAGNHNAIVPVPYCLNIHKTDTLSDVYAAIEGYTCAVRERIVFSQRRGDAETQKKDFYPVGLRLSAEAARELLKGDVGADPCVRLGAHTGAPLPAFRAFLDERHLYVTGINGFPYDAFHGEPVKEAVYKPDWSTPERFAYTCDLVDILAGLLPEGEVGSITTMPLTYWTLCPDGYKYELYARQITMVAIVLDKLYRETGKHIVLAIEPEPCCLLEDTDFFIGWFENMFLPEGKRWMCLDQRHAPAEAEEILRRHVGICFDTCHFSVMSENPLESVKQIEDAGIRIARVQLSAAIRATITSRHVLEALLAFAEPVYLHQVIARQPWRPHKLHVRFFDLPTTDSSSFPYLLKNLAGCEVRSHFHVPLFWEGNEVIGSTHGDLSPELFAHVTAKHYPLEIETYTFDVLPAELKEKDVVENLVRETEWVMERIAAAV